MRPLLTTVLLVAGFALTGVPAAGAPTGDAAANRLVARLYAPTHHPKVKRPWRIRITARSTSGRAVTARVTYAFLFNGKVVARRSPDNPRFRGTFRDTITWPANSVGYKLTFRAVVTSRIGRRNLDYWVRVRR